jgi:hypothetical protein
MAIQEPASKTSPPPLGAQRIVTLPFVQHPQEHPRSCCFHPPKSSDTPAHTHATRAARHPSSRQRARPRVRSPTYTAPQPARQTVGPGVPTATSALLPARRHRSAAGMDSDQSSSARVAVAFPPSSSHPLHHPVQSRPRCHHDESTWSLGSSKRRIGQRLVPTSWRAKKRVVVGRIRLREPAARREQHRRV